MKDTYEKVVEWEKEPDRWDRFIGILLLSSVGIIGILESIIHLNQSLLLYIIVILYSLLAGVMGILMIIYSFGEGRKVYYRRIK